MNIYYFLKSYLNNRKYFLNKFFCFFFCIKNIVRYKYLLLYIEAFRCMYPMRDILMFAHFVFFTVLLFLSQF